MVEWFDDLKVGMRFKSEAVTVSKDDIIRFAREYDPQPFHLDDEAAKKTILGGLARRAGIRRRLPCGSRRARSRSGRIRCSAPASTICAG